MDRAAHARHSGQAVIRSSGRHHILRTLRREGTTGIALLGGFKLTLAAAREVVLPVGSQRLLALLALHPRALNRSAVAGTLWPDATQDRAYASLRAALARLRIRGDDVIRGTTLELSLAANTTVDLEAGRTLAHHLIDPAWEPSDTEVGHDAISALSADLLPGWGDEWVLQEAEQWRRLRIRALEALAAWLVKAQRFGVAESAAMAAIAADPLRETARATLIRVHLAEGNQPSAIREFRDFRSLLMSECGLKPTEQLQTLVDGLG